MPLPPAEHPPGGGDSSLPSQKPADRSLNPSDRTETIPAPTRTGASEPRYPDRIMETFSVIPSPKVSDTVVEPYNVA